MVIETSNGGNRRVALVPDRAVGAVTREVLETVISLVGPVTIDPRPQEVTWKVPLDEDTVHARTTQMRSPAILPRLPKRRLCSPLSGPVPGRTTPVNAWWGSFDLAVSLFSGLPARPPSNDFIMRNAMDAQEVAIGWWPGDARHTRAAFYAYAHPAPEGFSGATLSPPAAHWDGALGEYILDWDDVRDVADLRATGLDFARSAFRHACTVCNWDRALLASAEGTPPPVS